MTLFAVSLTLTLVFVALAVGACKARALQGLGFTFCVLAVGSLAIAHPPLFVAWGGFELERAISPLVQLILFGMGMRLAPADFLRVFQMPKGVVLCCGLHYTVMPIGGYCYTRAFGLEGAVATGLILIGSVPTAAATSVIALLARANVPLAVTAIAISTLVSPFVTPWMMKWLAGTYVPIDAVVLMVSILKLIIAPLAFGFLVQHYLGNWTGRLVRVLPFVAMAAICLIIGVTVALSREQILTMGWALFGAAACLNATGYLVGYLGGRLATLSVIDARSVALAVGLQNGGMATGLAFEVLHNPAAALGSAVFGPWSAITSSVLASWWRQRVPSSADSVPVNPAGARSRKADVR